MQHIKCLPTAAYLWRVAGDRSRRPVALFSRTRPDPTNKEGEAFLNELSQIMDNDATMGIHSLSGSGFPNLGHAPSGLDLRPPRVEPITQQCLTAR
jgi:hypothetical protein